MMWTFNCLINKQAESPNINFIPFIIIIVEQAWLDFSHLSPVICARDWEGFIDTPSSFQPKPIHWYFPSTDYVQCGGSKTSGCHGCHTLIWIGKAGRVSGGALSNDCKMFPTPALAHFSWKKIIHCFCLVALLFYRNTCNVWIYSYCKNSKHLNSTVPWINGI